MRVNQARQQPALGHQLCTGNSVGGPPIPVGIQVHGIGVRQRETANPENRHMARLPDLCEAASGR
jgi:hypothetical protein